MKSFANALVLPSVSIYNILEKSVGQLPADVSETFPQLLAVQSDEGEVL